MLAVIAAGALWGIICIPTKALAAGGLGPVQITCSCMVCAAVLFCGFLAIRDPKKLRFRLRDIWMFLGTGALGVGCTSALYSYTMLQSQASVAVVLMYTSPIYVMLFGALLFHEKITPVKLAALVMCLAGCVFVTGMLGSAETITPLVLLTGLLSGLTFGLYTVFDRIALQHYDTTTVTAYTFVFAAAAQLPLCDVGGAVRIFAAAPELILWRIGGAIFCSLLPYGLYTWGLKRLESGTAAILACVEPLVGAVAGIVLYHEDHSPTKLLGIALILAAVILLSPHERKSKNV